MGADRRVTSLVRANEPVDGPVRDEVAVDRARRTLEQAIDAHDHGWSLTLVRLAVQPEPSLRPGMRTTAFDANASMSHGVQITLVGHERDATTRECAETALAALRATNGFGGEAMEREKRRLLALAAHALCDDADAVRARAWAPGDGRDLVLTRRYGDEDDVESDAICPIVGGLELGVLDGVALVAVFSQDLQGGNRTRIAPMHVAIGRDHLSRFGSVECMRLCREAEAILGGRPD